MPRKKVEVIEEKNSAEVKPKRKRRTPAEMAIFRAEQEQKKLERQKLAAEKKSAVATKNSVVKKTVEKVSELKNSAPEKLVGRGLANKNSAEKIEVDYKADGKEKLFALDIGTRSVIGIVAEKNSAGQLEIIATHREEHKTRAMLDGQIHDVPQVAAVINTCGLSHNRRQDKLLLRRFQRDKL